MSTYQTVDNALSALKSRISGLDWQNSEGDRVKIREAILDVVKNTSVNLPPRWSMLKKPCN